MQTSGASVWGVSGGGTPDAPRSHLGTLPATHCLPGPDLWVYKERGQGCQRQPGLGLQVGRAEMPTPRSSSDRGQLPMTTDSNRTEKKGFLRVALHTGQVRFWEKAAWLVLGRSSPTGFGIHSQFSAPVANRRLLSPKGALEGESLQGTPTALWDQCLNLCSPASSAHRRQAHGESLRPSLRRGSYVSNTVCQHT